MRGGGLCVQPANKPRRHSILSVCNIVIYKKLFLLMYSAMPGIRHTAGTGIIHQSGLMNKHIVKHIQR